jgi:hypothetical protein
MDDLARCARFVGFGFAGEPQVGVQRSAEGEDRPAAGFGYTVIRVLEFGPWVWRQGIMRASKGVAQHRAWLGAAALGTLVFGLALAGADVARPTRTQPAEPTAATVSHASAPRAAVNTQSSASNLVTPAKENGPGAELSDTRAA